MAPDDTSNPRLPSNEESANEAASASRPDAGWEIVEPAAMTLAECAAGFDGRKVS